MVGSWPGLIPMVLMMPERESSASSEEFMLRVGRVTSAEDIAKMSGSLSEQQFFSNRVTGVSVSLLCKNKERGFSLNSSVDSVELKGASSEKNQNLTAHINYISNSSS